LLPWWNCVIFSFWRIY